MNSRFLTIMFCCISFSLACKQAETSGDPNVNENDAGTSSSNGEDCHLSKCKSKNCSYKEGGENGGVHGGAANYTTITYTKMENCKTCKPCGSGFKKIRDYTYCKNNEKNQDDCAGL